VNFSGPVEVFWYGFKMSGKLTEQSLAEYAGLDTWDDERILGALVDSQERAIAAVRTAIPQIAKAATVLAQRLANGGKLFYAGAGTSIRIGIQDGSELPATFGMAEDKIAYLIAGGRAAMFETLADAEDDIEAGAKAAEACKASDVVVVIAASGSTPYTVAVAKHARQKGAYTIAVVNNPGSLLAAGADIEILLKSGPEVIAGSTRLGAGTAQKAALNLLSTLAHIKLGAVHDGLMVNVRAENEKLRKRASTIVMRIAGVSEQKAAAALDAAKGAIKPAVLLCAGAKSLLEAQHLLADTHGNLRLALKKLAAH
jgi:N-acetylmuramic acid 6-phosphate etherase